MSPNLVDEIFGGKGPKVDKKAKILERVRGLLAMADDSAATPEEADAHRAKADQLMAMYAIEQWQVDSANKDQTNRPVPEVRYMDFHWFYRSQFRNDLWTMFTAMASHCRVVIAHRGHGAGERSFYEIPIIGIPSDLDWFDLLFTSVMLQMGSQLEPKPDKNLTFGENCYKLRMSGMNRLRVAQLMWEAHMLPGIDTSEAFDNEYSPITKKALRAIRAAGEQYAKANGFETTKISTGVWQRSFSEGFAREIRRRVWSMQKLRNASPEMQSEDNHQAIALRDIYQMALELYREMWPEPEPIEVDTSEHGGSQRRRRVAMVREKKMSSRAVAAGQAAGARANLSGHPSKNITNPTKGLGS